MKNLLTFLQAKNLPFLPKDTHSAIEKHILAPKYIVTHLNFPLGIQKKRKELLKPIPKGGILVRKDRVELFWTKPEAEAALNRTLDYFQHTDPEDYEIRSTRNG